MKLFKIMAASALALMAQAGAAQTTLPYFCGFDNAQQQAGWTEYRKGDTGPNKWTVANTGYSAANSLYHGYPVGGTVPTIDWYVSPPFSFPAGGIIDSLRFSFSGFGTPMISDTVALYVLKGSPNPSQAQSLTRLLDFRGADYNNDGVWRLKANIAIPASAGQSFLAFKYVATNNWLDVQFDNLRLHASSSVGLANAEKDNGISVSPNPSGGLITFRSGDGERAAALKIYNALGGLVVERCINFGEEISPGLADGVYVYTLRDESGRAIKNGRIFIKSD